MADRKQQLVNKKLNMLAKALNSENYKKADRLIKLVNRMKEDVKKYCQENNITEYEMDEAKVKYLVRSSSRVDPNLLDPDVWIEATIESPVWIADITEKK